MSTFQHAFIREDISCQSNSFLQLIISSTFKIWPPICSTSDLGLLSSLLCFKLVLVWFEIFNCTCSSVFLNVLWYLSHLICHYLLSLLLYIALTARKTSYFVVPSFTFTLKGMVNNGYNFSLIHHTWTNIDQLYAYCRCLVLPISLTPSECVTSINMI